jgi:hypothetical protein
LIISQLHSNYTLPLSRRLFSFTITPNTMFQSLSSGMAMALLATLTLAAPAPSTTEIHFVDKRDASFNDFGEFDGSSSAKGYADGQGTYIKSGDDHRYGFAGTGEHCWTDFFAVTNRVQALDWKRDEASVDCASTSSCTIEKVDSETKCASWNLQGSITVGAGREILSKLLSIGGEVGLEAGGGGEFCTTAEAKSSCDWEDKLCHQAWRSDMQRVHEGYIRRRCDKGGDHTVWMHGE